MAVETKEALAVCIFTNDPKSKNQRKGSYSHVSCGGAWRTLNQLILSQSESPIAAAPDLPPHEVTSDFMLLMESAQSISPSQGDEDVTLSFTKLSHLIYCHGAFLPMNPTSWALAFDSLGRQQYISDPRKSASMRIRVGKESPKESEQYPGSKSKRLLKSLLSRRKSKKDETLYTYLDEY